MMVGLNEGKEWVSHMLFIQCGIPPPPLFKDVLVASCVVVISVVIL